MLRGAPPVSTWPNCGAPMVTLEPVPWLRAGVLKILVMPARSCTRKSSPRVGCE